MSLAIEATGLVKVFGDNRAVDGLDLRVPAGSVYGVLGPNGAGKTTAVKMLATLLRPDGGQATVFGHDVLRAGNDGVGVAGQSGHGFARSGESGDDGGTLGAGGAVNHVGHDAISA